MSAQRASAPARIASIAAAIVLVAVAAAVAVRLAGRREPAAPQGAVVAPPPQDRAVDRKERVRHEEYEAGRLVAEIRGDAFSRGADGLNRLTGSVEVKYLGPEGRTVSRLTCGEIAYEPGSLRFAVRGAVRVEAGDVVLEGESFAYDKAAGLFATSSGGRFSSGTFAGEAPEVSYHENADEVRLGGGFRVEMAGPGPEPKMLILSGKSLTYVRRERRGLAEGRTELRAGICLATADTVSFAVAGDDAVIESADLEGRAKAGFASDKPEGAAGGELEADLITIIFTREPFAVWAAAAEGQVRLTWSEPGAAPVRVEAPEAHIRFDRGGELPLWSAFGGIRAEIREADGSILSLECEEASFDRRAGAILAVSGQGRRPIADSPEARIEADWVMIRPAAGDLQASGGVQCVFRSEAGGPKPGFFAHGKSVLVTCDALSLPGRGAPAVFKGHARATQDQEFLEAEELEYFSEKAETRGRGGVTARLAGALEGRAAAGLVLMSGEEMSYLADTRILSFNGRAVVRLPEAGLEARTVTAVVASDGKALESLSARLDVTVTQGGYTGRAEAASYDPSTGLLVLTGNPVVTDGQGGSARGAKLTFDLADDKILLENEGPGRSTTVIKS